MGAVSIFWPGEKKQNDLLELKTWGGLAEAFGEPGRHLTSALSRPATVTITFSSCLVYASLSPPSLPTQRRLPWPGGEHRPRRNARNVEKIVCSELIGLNIFTSVPTCANLRCQMVCYAEASGKPSSENVWRTTEFLQKCSWRGWLDAPI